jgi:hypothetical protein
MTFAAIQEKKRRKEGRKKERKEGRKEGKECAVICLDSMCVA